MAMTPDVRPLVAGNWKMHGVKAVLPEIMAIRVAVDRGEAGVAELAVCPPATLIPPAAGIVVGSTVALGGQNCHEKISGPYTGGISAEMLKDAGCSYVIVGHSERRSFRGETDAQVRGKAEAARRAGLTAIVCVGETRAERDEGRALETVRTQVRESVPQGSTPATVVVAYEPIWAIGTGHTPTDPEVAEMHGSIRELLSEFLGEAGRRVRILYGGSVKPDNAKEFLSLPNVDGALVGGASLKALDFLAIAAAYR
jgi:triosephosphate isomerase